MSKIDRIRKLLNLADNAGAADGEADNARRIAAAMMEAEGITEADIAGAVGDGPPPWDAARAAAWDAARAAAWDAAWDAAWGGGR